MTEAAEPRIVPVAIDDLVTLLDVAVDAWADTAVADRSPDDRAALTRLREQADAAVAARHAYRTRGQFTLALDGIDAGNVLAGPGAHLPATHRNGHSTEVEAARRIDLRAGTLRVRALAELAAAGDVGLTDVELEARLEVRRPTGGNRRGELVKLGHVEEVPGVTRTVRPHGPAKCWRVTAAGIVALRGLGYAVSVAVAGRRIVHTPRPSAVG